MMFSHMMKELSTEKERERAAEVEEGKCMTPQAWGGETDPMNLASNKLE